MDRCDGYYRLENRRCDREAVRELRACDGEHYRVCEYHRRQEWTTAVAHWHGETDLRASTATGLRSVQQPRRTFAWG
ncbi:MAG TPA: hypothetical protein VES61_06540 [Gaiellaceae bacterium]|nr:hypothetical protein [Gaiellaceae bacterium]